jgi:hypothetical protein
MMILLHPRRQMGKFCGRGAVGPGNLWQRSTGSRDSRGFSDPPTRSISYSGDCYSGVLVDLLLKELNHPPPRRNCIVADAWALLNLDLIP